MTETEAPERSTSAGTPPVEGTPSTWNATLETMPDGADHAVARVWPSMSSWPSVGAVMAMVATSNVVSGSGSDAPTGSVAGFPAASVGVLNRDAS